MLSTCARALVEGMSTGPNSEMRRDAYAAVTAGILGFIIAVAILGFAGQWLWNNVIVELFSFAKPSRSIWLLVGLKFFVMLILG